MLGSPCSPCCGCDSASLLAGNIDISANTLERPWVKVDRGQSSTDYYIPSSLAWNAMVAAFDPTAQAGRALRYMVGYDEATGAHAFIEFETEGKVRLGEFDTPFSTFFATNTEAYQQAAEMSLWRSGFNEYMPRARYQTAADVSFSVATKLIGIVNASGTRTSIRWAAEYSRVRVRVGFALPGHETTLASAVIPAMQPLSCWIGCDKTYFTVAYLPGTSAAIEFDYMGLSGNRSFAGTFAIPGEIAAGTNTIAVGMRPGTVRSPAGFGAFASKDVATATAPEAQFPATTAQPKCTPGQANALRTRTLWRLPCGDSFSATTLGYSGGALSEGSAAIAPACRFLVRSFDSGQYALPKTYSRQNPFSSCSSRNAEAIHVTIKIRDSYGNEYSSPQALIDAMLARGEYTSLEAKMYAAAIAGALAGRHAMPAVDGSDAAWCMTLAESESFVEYASRTWNQPQTQYVRTTVRLRGGMLYAELLSDGITYRVFANVETLYSVNGQGGTANVGRMAMLVGTNYMQLIHYVSAATVYPYVSVEFSQ